MAQLPQAGQAGASNSLGVVLERWLPRMAPEVLVPAGLGLIGAVIWTSLEAE
jgi:hypothetical protein